MPKFFESNHVKFDLHKNAFLFTGIFSGFSLPVKRTHETFPGCHNDVDLLLA